MRYRRTGAVSSDGSRRSRGPLQPAVLADAYREAFALAGLPIPVQRALASATPPVGRLAGYRARYERHGESA